MLKKYATVIVVAALACKTTTSELSDSPKELKAKQEKLLSEADCYQHQEVKAGLKEIAKAVKERNDFEFEDYKNDYCAQTMAQTTLNKSQKEQLAGSLRLLEGLQEMYEQRQSTELQMASDRICSYDADTWMNRLRKINRFGKKPENYPNDRRLGGDSSKTITPVEDYLLLEIQKQKLYLVERVVESEKRYMKKLEEIPEIQAKHNILLRLNSIIMAWSTVKSIKREEEAGSTASRSRIISELGLAKSTLYQILEIANNDYLKEHNLSTTLTKNVVIQAIQSVDMRTPSTNDTADALRAMEVIRVADSFIPKIQLLAERLGDEDSSANIGKGVHRFLQECSSMINL